MELADKIIQLRKRQGWSQEELADRMEVSRQAVSKWESAQSMPDIEKLLRLSSLFNVSTDYLLKAEAEPSVSAEIREQSGRVVTMDMAARYLDLRRHAARRISAGVFLCISGAAPLVWVSGWGVSSAVLLAALVYFFLSVACGVVLFITAGSHSGEYAFLEQAHFILAPGVESMVRAQQEGYHPGYIRSNIIGAVLCLLAPTLILVGIWATHTHLIVFILFIAAAIVIIAVGAAIFTKAGIPWTATQKLLQEGDYTPERKRSAAIEEIVGAVYWLLVTACYLVWSFVDHAWDRSWILWVVGGIVYAAVAVVTRALNRHK